ncbi:unnamed protein product [Linum trigynum]|uniref:Uncharacterized protein n=1 Tax=Linum trigynum TaxID=586398 RepID=A0AAV2CWE9_9ROSI
MDLDSNYFPAFNRTRSGYEPSDAETDWRESPIQIRSNGGGGRATSFDSDTDMELPPQTLTSSNRQQQQQARKFNDDNEYNNNNNNLDHDHNSSSSSSSADGTNSIASSTRRKTKNQRPRSTSATRTRANIKDQDNGAGLYAYKDQKQLKKNHPPPLYPSRATSVGELNEMIGTMKLSRAVPGGGKGNPMCESTDSLSPGDIFFSRDVTSALPPHLQKNGRFQQPDFAVHNNNNNNNKQETTGSEDVNMNDHKASTRSSSSSSGSRTTATSTNSTPGYFHSSGKMSSDTSSKVSDMSGRTTESVKAFVANRKKSQSSDSNWLSCIKGRSCRTNQKSPEKEKVDESTYIARANVVESLSQFWADKYQPSSLKAFSYHKQEAQLLRKLVSQDSIPHILFKGPSISGKKGLMMALLGDIFGDACSQMSHDLRFFQAQEKKGAQVVVPITSSAHHVELNVKSEPNAMSALMGLVKEISNAYSLTPEVSTINFRPDYKVIVLYEADRATENIQHLIKWIMDCYTDCCKLILCCDDDLEMLESVRNRCKVVNVDAPATHEIMEFLVQISKKEGFDLPMNFAAKIATKAKDLRRAIMALEACKAHNYPFANDQPIPIFWEEVLVEIATEIMADPSPKRLFLVRGKLQKLLVDFVNPQLILQKLVEQFLKEMPSSSKRELYYWHGYYEKRLPAGTTALLKLEEFVAKFMGMYRKSIGNRQF